MVFSKNPHAFDLVICDLTMPEMTGDILAQKLRALRPDLPIVLCTGFQPDKFDQIGSDCIDVILVDQISVVSESLASFVRAARLLGAVACFDGLAGVLHSVGIEIAHGENPGLSDSEDFPHVSHAHAPDADEAERYAIAGCICAEDRSRHDCRTQQRRGRGRGRASEKLSPRCCELTCHHYLPADLRVSKRLSCTLTRGILSHKATRQGRRWRASDRIVPLPVD